jgi:hypothetical protein
MRDAKEHLIIDQALLVLFSPFSLILLLRLIVLLGHLQQADVKRTSKVTARARLRRPAHTKSILQVRLCRRIFYPGQHQGR